MKTSPTFILLFLLGALIPVKGLSREKPSSFISDPSHWLPRESRESLETFLQTRSSDLSIEVYLLLEPPLKPSSDEARDSLQELGNSWSKNNWAIISYRPGQLGAPMIVSGGPFLETVQGKFWEEEILTLQDLSVQTWTDHPDINFLTKALSDSLVFISRVNDTTRNEFIQKWRKEEMRKLKDQKTTRVITIIIIIPALFLLGLVILLLRRLYLKHRKMTFPETKWSQRLQAPHCGGSSLNHRF